MGERLFKDWPVYVLMGIFIWFVAAVYRNGKREEKKRQQEKNKSQEK